MGESALDLGPRWLRRAAAVALAVGLTTHAAWATSLITGYAKHRAAALMSALQNTAVQPAAPAPHVPARKG